MKTKVKSLCRLEGLKDKTTAGDLFYLHCEWPELSPSLLKPVRVKLKEDLKPYTLEILKEDIFLPGKASFTVTSYRTGDHSSAVLLIDAKGRTVESAPLSWSIQSVISAHQNQKPYPPFGPWTAPLPLWYWPLCIVLFCALGCFLFFKIRKALKRRKLIKNISARLKNKTAFREFISQVTFLTRRLSELTKKELISQIKKQFSLFLENQFFISAVDQDPRSIVKQMNYYLPFIKSAQRKMILNFYTELEKSSSENITQEDLERLVILSRKNVIQLYETVQQKGRSFVFT